jgi:hypothetical protein
MVSYRVTQKRNVNLFTINFYLSMTVPYVHGAVCTYYLRVKAIYMRSGVYVQLMRDRMYALLNCITSAFPPSPSVRMG